MQKNGGKINEFLAYFWEIKCSISKIIHFICFIFSTLVTTVKNRNIQATKKSQTLSPIRKGMPIIFTTNKEFCC